MRKKNFIAEPIQIHEDREIMRGFVDESREMLDEVEPMLIELESISERSGGVDSEVINKIFRLFHSMKGSAGFLELKTLGKLTHVAETFLDKFRKGIGLLDSSHVDLLNRTCDLIRLLLDQISAEYNDHGFEEEVGVVIDALKLTIVEIERENIEKSQTDRSKKQNESIKKISVRGNNKVFDRRAQYGRRAKDDQNSELPTVQRQSLRVDIEKLDRLLDVVGELMIAESMVVQNPDLKEHNFKLENFEKSVQQLDKITREIQDTATSIRMIPLTGTFRMMIRLVRDLVHKAGKKVELKLIGEDAEVDKTVIEHIYDPIVHAIRNAIDHGIGPPEERLSVGKSEIGQLTLEAKYVGGEVWIIVRDDGRGLNRNIILSKAIDRGLITGNGADLKDWEVWQLIFDPGFSTAEKVSEISGRGVGMDILRRHIESIRGRVEVRSREGEGTEVILRIPLTWAIIEGMIVRVEDAIYTIPISAIRESLKISKDQITEMTDFQEVVRIRDQLIPVIRLHEFFGGTPNGKNLDEGILMVVGTNDKSLCFFVDEVVGQRQIVLKGIPRFIGNLNGISGFTILGDGSICPIINVAEVFRLSEFKERRLSVA